MSHGYLVALVPNDITTNKIESFISDKMAFYHEELEVPEYLRDCYCIGSDAREDVKKASASKFGEDFIVKLREKYWALSDTERTDTKWDEMIKPFQDFENHLESSHPMKNLPSPNCSECNGTGKYPTTYNPNSKWDWYVVGGRWNGAIRRAERDDEDGGFNFGGEFHQLKENMIKVSELFPLTDKDIPYAILTPDGKWNQRGQLGWWGMSSDEVEKDNWVVQAIKIFESFSDHIAVGLDYHI